MQSPLVVPEFEDLAHPPAHLGAPVDVPGSVWMAIWVALAILVVTAGVVR